jgi:cytochrome c553
MRRSVAPPCFRSILALSLLAMSAGVAAQAPVRPIKLGQCVACHGDAGRARASGIPHLAGQDEQYLVSALLAYRGGQRRHPLMNSIANTLQPRDIQALAHWYSSQPAGGR